MEGRRGRSARDFSSFSTRLHVHFLHEQLSRRLILRGYPQAISGRADIDERRCVLHRRAQPDPKIILVGA
jgi:hypothetical protein